MKVFSRIILALVVLFGLALVVAAFLPKHYEYERTAEINAPKEVVFAIVNDLKTQETWGPWEKEDSTLQTSYNEVASGVGQISTWTSENSGNGSQRIIESTPPTAAKYRVEFEGSGGGDAWFKLEDGEGGSTKTSWGMAMDISWPWNLMSVMMGGTMNKMLEDGLAGLKEMAEQKAAEAPASAGNYAVKAMDFPGKSYLGIREKTTHEEVMKSTYFAERFGKIMALLGQSKMQPAGSPSGVYFTWDTTNKTTDMAVAIPVTKGTAVAGANLQIFEVPASKAVVVDYYGPYDNFEGAHQAIGAYIEANGLKEKSPVIEEYVTDPMTEKDSTKWLTKIIYLIEGK